MTSVTACALSSVQFKKKKFCPSLPTEDDGTDEGYDGYDVPLSLQDFFGTSLDIAGPLDMSMEGPPLTPGVNIFLQTPFSPAPEAVKATFPGKAFFGAGGLPRGGGH
ncbi:hypothetical protein E2C01_055905 [Portunus trituberculatus]|uniref:Uncharacterized protein n=1 Tax=Portunus trituberculatus TaxID=210409 RepID=A0A5B7GY78_PORTR|nr:hypothetical protein [Portunus trituberculatus]